MIHIDSSPGCVDLLVDRHVRAGRGENLALVEHGSAGRRCLSYRQLQQLTIAAAQELNIRLGGSRRQQRIALAGSATLENIVYWLGAMRAGHLVFMVPPTLPADHYEGLWESFDPDLVLADYSAVSIDAQAMSSVAELAVEKVELHGLCEVSDIAASLDLRPALVLATSGSTGRPKLCVHSHRAFWQFERMVSRRLWDIRASDRVLASTGPFFSFGLQGVHVPLSVGAAAVLLPEWQQHTDFLEVIETECVSVFLAVPTLYHLLMSRATRSYRFDALRLSLSAGERLPQVIRERWQEWTGAQMLDSIGTTETFSPYLSELAAGPAALQEVEGFRYSERVHAGGGESVVFSLGLSGGCLMLGYLSNGASELLDPAPAIFETNDLFVRDDDGLYFVSRDSERIKISGYWVSPQELEEFLLADKRVVKAAAFPLVTPEGLTRLRAYVVADGSGYSGSALVHDLMKRIREDLHPRALRPDRIELVADIATTPSGKLKRQELRSLLTHPCAGAGAVLVN